MDVKCKVITTTSNEMETFLLDSFFENNIYIEVVNIKVHNIYDKKITEIYYKEIDGFSLNTKEGGEMNKHREYQKLEYPKLVELKNDLNFIIATEIDISMISNGLVFLRGQLYNYDDGLAVKLNNKTEICYHTDENFYEEVDENGYYTD